MAQNVRQGRQVARRVFSREFNQSTYTFRESDEERAPVFVLLPTGQSANRVFVVGTLTETENVGEDTEYWRGRIVDPIGTFFLYAGQYQSDAMDLLREAETPAYVAITGKPRTYETDSGNTNVSLRPEAMTIVDDETRRRWVVETADRTIERIRRFDDPDNEYATMAREHYNVSLDTFKEFAIEAIHRLNDETS